MKLLFLHVTMDVYIGGLFFDEGRQCSSHDRDAALRLE